MAIKALAHFVIRAGGGFAQDVERYAEDFSAVTALPSHGMSADEEIWHQRSHRTVDRGTLRGPELRVIVLLLVMIGVSQRWPDRGANRVLLPGAANQTQSRLFLYRSHRFCRSRNQFRGSDDKDESGFWGF
jgi:hypothetical protein